MTGTPLTDDELAYHTRWYAERPIYASSVFAAVGAYLGLLDKLP